MVHNSCSPTKQLPDPVAGDRANMGGRRSPKRWRKVELDGVGLGIVAALEKASCTGATAATPIAIVSPRAAEGRRWRTEAAAAAELGGDKFPVAEFLKQCHLCGKRLHGKDVYIYRGEKAFCSAECRYQQIINDDFQEKRGLDILAAQSEISSSPCSVGGSRRLFFTGIVVS